MNSDLKDIQQRLTDADERLRELRSKLFDKKRHTAQELLILKELREIQLIIASTI